MQVPDRSRFSPTALERWDELDTPTQAKLLGNVWCRACSKAVHIFIESAQLEKKNLILSGRCANCGGNLTRLIEGE